MNARVSVIVLTVFGFFASALFAQRTANKNAGSLSSPCVVHLTDGGRIVAKISQRSIEIVIEDGYGKLTIPFENIRKIEFGFRCPPETEKEITSYINNLGSNDFKEREVAQKELVGMGYLSYPFVKKASKNDDLEIGKRAKTAAERIQAKTSANLLSLKDYDILQTEKDSFRGKISGSAFEAHSLLGEITIKFHDICSVVRNAEHRGEIVIIDAAQYGSLPEKWLDTGIETDQNTHLIIEANGQVDLWPQGPGQYMAGPKGYTTAGKGSNFMAGALVGRIGEGGAIFLIGEKYNDAPNVKGRLFLQIVPSPWNNASSGNYRVKVETNYAAR